MTILDSIKLAALQDHQQRVVDKLSDTDALLVYHGMGSGKTLTALAAAEALGMPMTVVGPASLRGNFAKERLKHKIGPEADYYSYNKPPEKAKGLLVFDEAHRMGRAGTQRSQYPDRIRSEKALLMTGTPIRNEPSELIPLMRGLGIKDYKSPQAFREEFIKRRQQSPGFWGSLRGIKPGLIEEAQNLGALKKLLKGKVDYYAPSTENYPSVDQSDVVVEMSPQQEKAYMMALRGKPSLMYKIEHGIAPSKAESGEMNAFLTATRQISNFPGDYNLKAKLIDAPKIVAAASAIKKRLDSDPNYRGVTYSNYLSHGIDPLERVLKVQGVPYSRYTGQMTQRQKDEAVKAYNEGRIRQLLISGAGGEGLDLKGTKLLQVMEPHWNEPLIDQVKARAIRYRSHEHLPENERRVEVQNLLAVPRKKGLLIKKRPMSADQYLRMLSERKTRLNEQFLTALREVGA